jgi:hypothetical protein
VLKVHRDATISTIHQDIGNFIRMAPFCQGGTGKGLVVDLDDATVSEKERHEEVRTEKKYDGQPIVNDDASDNESLESSLL